MTIDDPADDIIEIDPSVDYAGSIRARPVPKSVPIVVALVIGVLLGFGAAVVNGRAHPRSAPVAPAATMHTVVITEDGRSQTFSVPSGSQIATPAVRNSCSITVDGQFVAYLNRVIGNAECAATIR